MEKRWPSPDWEDAPPVYSAIYRNLFWLVRGALRPRVRGVERVPLSGPLIVASNHLSYMDPLVVSCAFPRPVHWLGKKEVFKGKLLTSFFTSGGVVPVDRKARGSSREAFNAARRILSEGRVVGLYPEGTRQVREKAGVLRESRTGVARLAYLTGASVVPVGVATEHLWGKGQSVPRFGAARTFVAFGDPVPFPLDPARAEDADEARKATERVMSEVGALLREALDARDAGDAWDAPRKVKPAA